MTDPTTARDTILSRIRTALPAELAHVDPANLAASYAAIPHLYNRAGALTPHARLDLFLDRLLDYDTEILQLTSDSEIPAAVTQALANETNLLADPTFPPTWLPPNLTLTLDHNLPIATLDLCKTVITTCQAAVASTGTIILLHHGPQGRRVITLLPDHHICLVRRDQIFETIPQALASLDPANPAPITTISGPSATSDIEMTRIRGVHGPRRLTVILHGPLPPA